MPSPFPGMDPYLEDPGLWPDVHHEFISEMRAVLNRRLDTRYVARIEERVYIADDDETDPPSIRVPDLRISRQPGNGRVAAKPSEATLTLPITFQLLDDEIHEARIEIKDAAGNQVVTVIELLNPANKRPGTNGHKSFREKRDQVLASKCHWVEIDLLRAGRPASRRPVGGCDYAAMVSPAKLRPKGLLWPISLRHPLPTIGIPLRGRDPDVLLDLQAVLTSAYDRGAYDRTVDYRAAPNPPFPTSDAAWANALLRKKKLRP